VKINFKTDGLIAPSYLYTVRILLHSKHNGVSDQNDSDTYNLAAIKCV